MYEYLSELISAPSNADPYVMTASCFIVVMLFILCVDILVNSLFGLFRRRK